MKELSIIIVSWNARDFLEDCLRSIRTTGSAALREVIVVDNASTDGSDDLVTLRFPEATLIRSAENLGFARANNLGMLHASGKYLGLVNSDVVVNPNCFEKLIAFLEDHKEVGLAGPKIFGADGRLQRTCRLLPTFWNTACRCLALDTVFPKWPLFSGREMRHWSQEMQAEVEVLSGCFWMARREAVDQVGMLDERFFFYAEDVDWCKRFRDKGWKVMFVPEATAIHFGGASSSKAPLRYSIEMLRANLCYWRKHHGLFGEFMFYLLSILHHVFRLPLRRVKRVFSRNSGPEAVLECQRDFICLRWLITGKGV